MSLCPAIQMQNRLSSPSFGTLEAYLPKGLLLWKECFLLHRHRYVFVCLECSVSVMYMVIGTRSVEPTHRCTSFSRKASVPHPGLHSAKGGAVETGCSDFMMLYISLLYDTNPMHCTPLPLHPPVMNTHPGGRSRGVCNQGASLNSSRWMILSCW